MSVFIMHFVEREKRVEKNGTTRNLRQRRKQRALLKAVAYPAPYLHFPRRTTHNARKYPTCLLRRQVHWQIFKSYRIYFHIRRRSDSDLTRPKFLHFFLLTHSPYNSELVPPKKSEMGHWSELTCRKIPTKLPEVNKERSKKLADNSPLLLRLRWQLV